MNRLEKVQQFLAEQYETDDVSNHYSIHNQNMDPEVNHLHVRRGTLAARIRHFLGQKDEPTMMPSQLNPEHLNRLRAALISRELKRGRGEDPGDLPSTKGRTPSVNLSPEEIESARKRIRAHLERMGSTINLGDDQ